MHLDLAGADDLAEGRMDDQQRQFWLSHLADCSHCGGQMEEWRKMREALRRAHLESAPRDVYSKAVAIFRNPETAQNKAEKEPIVRRLIASLAFDSFQQPALAGVRSAGTAEARQLVLVADPFDIHARIWTEQDRYRLDGQILPRGETERFAAPVQLCLVVNGRRTHTTVSDRFGEFQFRDIPKEKGQVVIEVDLPHLTVVGLLFSEDPTGPGGAP